VKIFSKKVEIKNVSSKIGSLEKAATYVPSGGNVVVKECLLFKKLFLDKNLIISYHNKKD